MTPSDGELLRRTAAGDHGAFEAFVRVHQDALWRYLVARNPSHADAQDALQETFLAAYRGAGSFRGAAPGGDEGASARGWLLGIGRNVSRRLHRRRVGEPEHTLPLEELGARAGWGSPSVDPAFLRRLESRDTLRHALGRLTPEDREILVLRELEGLPGEEVAHLLELGIPAMKSRLHRARLRLAAVLNGDSEHA